MEKKPIPVRESLFDPKHKITFDKPVNYVTGKDIKGKGITINQHLK